MSESRFNHVHICEKEKLASYDDEKKYFKSLEAQNYTETPKPGNFKHWRDLKKSQLIEAEKNKNLQTTTP